MNKNDMNVKVKKTYGHTEAEYKSLSEQDRVEKKHAERAYLLNNPVALKQFLDEGGSL